MIDAMLRWLNSPDHTTTEKLDKLENEWHRMFLLFRHVFDSTFAAMIVANKDDHIIAWNAAAQLMFGFTELEALGQSVKIIIPEEYRGMHDASFHRYATTGESRLLGRQVELIGMRKGGTRFDAEISLTSWTCRLGERYFLAVIRDISDRKKAEQLAREKLTRLGELEKKLQALMETTHTLEVITSGTPVPGADGSAGTGASNPGRSG